MTTLKTYEELMDDINKEILRKSTKYLEIHEDGSFIVVGYNKSRDFRR